MRMIQTYEDFIKIDSLGLVKADVHSRLGEQGINQLREKGWKIRHLKAKKDLLAICRLSSDNFKTAWSVIDFWADDKEVSKKLTE